MGKKKQQIQRKIMRQNKEYEKDNYPSHNNFNILL